MLQSLLTCDELTKALDSKAALELLQAQLSGLALENEQLHSRVREQEARLEAYADQVIQDFEERSWFEELAGLEVCDVTNDIKQIAARLLPHLQQIIHAEALTFVRADRNGSSQSPAVSGSQYWLGEEALDKELGCRLVNRYRHDAGVRPIVRNGPSSVDEQAEFPGIDSFVLVAVARRGLCLGWLLAINRQSPAHMSGFGQDSFGTADARLMQSAAVVLATHNHSMQLFQANKELALGAIQSLAGTVDAKDSYTRGHSDRVAHMARQLGYRLGLDLQQQEQMLMTGLLHDIGKLGVPDKVLGKPGKLTEAEFALIKRHPTIGYRILEPIKSLRYALPGVLQHHEAVDGSGYPGGLKGHEISRCGRILAIVDAYDAMTSNRPYRDGMPFETAEGILRSGAGSQWDLEMVPVFLEHVEDFRHICRASRQDGDDSGQVGVPVQDHSAETDWARAVSRVMQERDVVAD